MCSARILRVRVYSDIDTVFDGADDGCQRELCKQSWFGSFCMLLYDQSPQKKAEGYPWYYRTVFLSKQPCRCPANNKFHLLNSGDQPHQTVYSPVSPHQKNPEMDIAVHMYISTETGLMKEIKQPCSLIITTISVAHVKVLSSHSRGFNVVSQIPANCPLK